MSPFVAVRIFRTKKSPYYQVELRHNGKVLQRTTKKKLKKDAIIVAEEFKKEFEKKLNTGVNPSDTLLFDYMDSWIKEVDVKETTRENYAGIIKNHIKEFTELNVPLASITPSLIRQFVQFLKNYTVKSGYREGEFLAPISVRKAFALLSQILNTAFIDEKIYSNPCKKVKCPKADRHVLPVLSEEEFKSLLDFAANTKYALMIYIFCFGAIRRGEAAALRYSDFNRTDHSCTITKSRTKVNIEYESTTKTETSKRIIFYPDIVFEELEKEKKRQEEYKEKYGSEYQDNDYVFKTEYGKPYSVGRFTKVVRELTKKAGVTVVSPHRLRATLATVMLNNEDNEFSLSDISRLLGHKNTLVTQQYYAIYDTKKLKSVAKKLGRIYSNKVSNY